MKKKLKCNFSGSNNIQFSEEALSQDFVPIKIYAIAEGVNRNRSSFLLTAMEDAIPSFYEKPILGYFNAKTNDFEEHNSELALDRDTNPNEYYWSYLAPNSEKPIGLIRASDTVTIEEWNGKKWIVLSASIWARYNREALKALLQAEKKKISVEISVEESYTAENGVEIIQKFTLDGITILGKYPGSNREVQEGIEGAHLLIGPDGESFFSGCIKALNFAYNEFADPKKDDDKACSEDEEDDDDNDEDDDEEGGEENPEDEDEDEGEDDDNDDEGSVNEKEPETEFSEHEDDNNERGNSQLNFENMTYSQKREILARTVEKKFETDARGGAWLCDFSDNEVVYCTPDGRLWKASYGVLEGTSDTEVYDDERAAILGYVEFSGEDIRVDAALEKYKAELISTQAALGTLQQEYNTVETTLNTEREQRNNLKPSPESLEGYVEIGEVVRREETFAAELEAYRADAEAYAAIRDKWAGWKKDAEEFNMEKFIAKAHKTVDLEVSATFGSHKFNSVGLKDKVASMCREGKFASEEDMEKFVQLETYAAIKAQRKEQQFSMGPLADRSPLMPKAQGTTDETFEQLKKKIQ